MHERSVNKQRYDAIQRIRSERYAAAKAAQPEVVAAYEKQVESRRKRVA